MWTPIILLCLTTNLTDCLAIGGPASASKKSCMASAQEVGTPYLNKKYGDEKTVVEYKCVRWDTNV
jgi:hypothetical protein